MNVARTDNGAVITAKGGMCGGGEYTAVISLICNKNSHANVLVNTYDNYNECRVEFAMETAVACGGGGGKASVKVKVDVGMVMCLLFFIPLICYFVIGAMWVEEAQGGGMRGRGFEFLAMTCV